ncbi:hypothetical protein SLEP1_g50621 [Rubroshorea leprosula]|uniref:F-box domain-containing protein n=1 Tax=Rubroshorea leprosula TaxID=152421 RepID=A0AAV5M436_9ROSI|nr:hypothetical protein SLEP1_g50621 [Rubroshorea leprosula]
MSQQLTPDRLSDLPDDILHCIMGFLSGKDIASMAALSRRFRSAWSVFPVIDINKSVLTNDLLAAVKLSLQRLRATHIFGLNKFRLNFEFIRMNQHSPIRELIDSVMENNVKELDVNFCPPKLFEQLRIFYSLKTLQLEDYHALQMDIVAPNLEYFSLIRKLSRCLHHQWIDMSSCKSVRTLILETPGVSEEWLAIHLSNFSLLENIKIMADRLNSFVCKGNNWSICQIDIEAKCLRNLEIEISINKPMPCFVVHLPSTCYEVKLILKLHMQAFEVGFWFKVLTDFLVCFGHCKVSTLVCNSAKVLSFLEELRDDMVPPLLDLKHLKVEIFPCLVLPWHD